MNKPVTRVMLAAMCVVGALLCRVAVAAPPAQPATKDAYAIAEAAMKAGEYGVARQYLLQFIKTGGSDTRLSAAKELLPETWMRQAEALVKAKMEPEAATVLMECVAHYKQGGYADRARERALKCLRDAYVAATRSKDFEKAVDCADRYAEFFPEQELAPQAELRELRADWLADSVRMRIDSAVLYERLKRAMKAGVTAADLRKRQLSVNQIRQAFARSLFEDGYYDKAVELLKEWEDEPAAKPEPQVAVVPPPPPPVDPPAEPPAPTDPPKPPEIKTPAPSPPTTTKADKAAIARDAAARKDLTAMLTKTLVQHAEALVGLGNKKMLADALVELESHAPTAADPSGKAAIAKVKKALAAGQSKRGSSGKQSDVPPGPPPPPRVLKFDKPVTGTAVWTDDGTGNTIEGTVTIGGDDKPGKIIVGPGFVLEGGSFFLAGGGTLDLQGEPGRPVIFRKVHIAQDLNAMVEAKFALFEDCTFAKGGGWFNHYSSKWVFTDCLLLKSNFADLSGVNYGIQIRGCGFFMCKLPPRYLCADPANDAARTYNDGWNAVEENGFDLCEMPPSFVWTTKRCAFTLCKVTGEETFRSTTPLQVLMAVPPGSQDFMRQLQVNTQRDSAGAVQYVNAAAKGPIKRRKMPAWKFARSQ